MSKAKVHEIDPGKKMGVGIEYPSCLTGKAGFDYSKMRNWKMSGLSFQVTCEKCLKIISERQRGK